MQRVAMHKMIEIKEHNCFIVGDIFVTNNAQILIRCITILPQPPEFVTLIVYELDHWFDKEKSTVKEPSTILVKRSSEYTPF